jgi:hypothetical protein
MLVKARLTPAADALRWILIRAVIPAAPQKETPAKSSISNRVDLCRALVAASVSESAVAMSISPVTARQLW